MKIPCLIKSINGEDYFHTKSYNAFLKKLSFDEINEFAEIKENLKDSDGNRLDDSEFRKIVQYALQNKLRPLYEKGIDFDNMDMLSLNEVRHIFTELFAQFSAIQISILIEIFEVTIIKYATVGNDLQLINQLIEKSSRVKELEIGEKQDRYSDRRFTNEQGTSSNSEILYGRCSPKDIKRKVERYQRRLEEMLNFLESFSSYFSEKFDRYEYRALKEEARSAMNRVSDLVNQYYSKVESDYYSFFFYLMDTFYKQHTLKTKHDFKSNFDFINQIGLIFLLPPSTEEDTGIRPALMADESIRKRIQKGRRQFMKLEEYYNEEEKMRVIELKNKIISE